MLEIRITVLRDKPASDVLKGHAPHGYRLYQDTRTNLYFLIEGRAGRFAPSPFWGGYDPVLNLPCDFDTSFLDRFGAEHANALDYYTAIDPLMVKDAQALSKTFSTRVLCAYANDEDDDFAIVAENGELRRIRFKAGRRRGKRLDDETAGNIETEIHATRIFPETDNPEDDGVYEYTAYEAIQSPESPLSLQPYWDYIEGEIGRQVIFRTISSTPDSRPPDLLFRNAFLEFEAAFGQDSPDFTDMADPDRFQEIDSQVPRKPSKIVKAFKALTQFPRFILSSPKRIGWTALILFILAAGIFGDRDDRTRTQIEFAENCTSVDGEVVGDEQDRCIIKDNVYRYWNLPGEKGERRHMAFVIGKTKVPCPTTPERLCLEVNGEPLDIEIEGVTIIEDQAQIVFVDRIQRCDPNMNQICSTPAEMFVFERRLSPRD